MINNEQIWSLSTILRAMALNYVAGHCWDQLDGEAVAKAADGIESLLAEREADKALIAELTQRLQREQDYALSSDLDRMEMHKQMEARTLTVTFDPIPMEDLGNRNEGKKHPYMFGAGYNSAVVSCKCALENACRAAGITLTVGGE